MRLLSYFKTNKVRSNNPKVEKVSPKNDSIKVNFKVVSAEEHKVNRNSAYEYIIP